MAKSLSWVATVAYPGKEPLQVGNLITREFDPMRVRMEFNDWIRRFLPDGFELQGFRRGKLKFEAEA